MSIVLTIDAQHVLKKWSTWLAALCASCSAGLYAYMQLPFDVQAKFPAWVPLVLGVGSILSAMLVPAATSIQQRNIPSTTFDPVSTEELP